MDELVESTTRIIFAEPPATMTTPSVVNYGSLVLNQTTGLPGVYLGENITIKLAYPDPNDPNCQSSYELVIAALTLPLWTFAILYLMLLLIQYLRQFQHYSLYDKCTWRNAHFRYDFHLIIGKHSANYNRNEAYIILDLLDNQLVSTMTVQIPGTTMFNEHQVFVYRHSRNDLRCVDFTVYRRHPIKDIKSIRIAHTCNNPESRIFIYGLQVHDETNGENRFFPIQSVVKYRGTQWALVTTFEPRPDMNFAKLGLDCYDPFGRSSWPTYLEVLTILLYIWCATFCLGHLIAVREIFASLIVHALTIFFITATSAAVLTFIYLRLIKTRIVDNYYSSCWWLVGQCTFIALLIAVSVGLWTLALSESTRCYSDALDWFLSTITCSTALTVIVIFTWCAAGCRRRAIDRRLLTETDSQMIKTNSRDNLTFVNDPKPGLCTSLFTRQSRNSDAHSSGREGPPKNWNALGPQVAKGTASSKKNKSQETQIQRQKHQQQEQPTTTAKEADETLDTAFGVGSKYIKARNRNSISQYV